MVGDAGLPVRGVRERVGLEFKGDGFNYGILWYFSF